MRKAQFGPDALIGLVLLALLSLGGIYFIHVFVNGITVESIISVLDQEIDQKCFFMLLPLMGDDYIRSGINVSNDANFNKMFSYYGGYRQSMDVSTEFKKTVDVYTEKLKTTPLGQKPTYVKGNLASKDAMDKLRVLEITSINDDELQLTLFCFAPVYNPAGFSGSAELIVAEDTDACGSKDKECCAGLQCDSGLTCTGTGVGVCY